MSHVEDAVCKFPRRARVAGTFPIWAYLQLRIRHDHDEDPTLRISVQPSSSSLWVHPIYPVFICARYVAADDDTDSCRYAVDAPEGWTLAGALAEFFSTCSRSKKLLNRAHSRTDAPLSLRLRSQHPSIPLSPLFCCLYGWTFRSGTCRRGLKTWQRIPKCELTP